jgi:hypothetical protein
LTPDLITLSQTEYLTSDLGRQLCHRWRRLSTKVTVDGTAVCSPCDREDLEGVDSCMAKVLQKIKQQSMWFVGGVCYWSLSRDIFYQLISLIWWLEGYPSVESTQCILVQGIPLFYTHDIHLHT